MSAHFHSSQENPDVEDEHEKCPGCTPEVEPEEPDLEVVAADLDRLEVGRSVADYDGDLWQKQTSGNWAYDLHYRLPASALVSVFGPIKIIPEEGL